MKKYFPCSLILLTLSACNAGSTSGSGIPTCPVDAPLFSEELGTSLINQWGSDAFNYSPYGAYGYTDSYVGAAYFTGSQYLSDAVLVPTVSPVTRSGSQEIYDYFTTFLAHGPEMTNNPESPESGGPWVTYADCGYGVISGYYNFNYMDGTPETTARYTFQFQYLSSAANVSINIESGTESNTTVTITQQPGWYVMLQNSGKLPSTTGLPSNLVSY